MGENPSSLYVKKFTRAWPKIGKIKILALRISFFIATKFTGEILQWRITADKIESGTKKWYESYSMIHTVCLSGYDNNVQK